MATSTAESQQADERTLDDEIGATWDALSDEGEGETEAAAEDSTADEAGDEGAAPETAGGESEEASAEGAEDAEQEDSESAESEESGEESPTVEPPQDWSTEWKEKFAKIDTDEGRRLLVDQYKSFQADYTRKTQELADVRKAFEPLREQLQLAGMSEGQYAQRLVAADRYLARDPVEGLKWLMSTYGVKPEQIAGGDAEQDEFTDPQISKLQKEVQDLRGELQQRDQQHQETQQQSFQRQIQEFAEATDESGAKAHPHFEDVKAHMGALLESGAAKDLDEAYDQAVWARPELREKLLSEREAAAKEKAEAARKAKAEKARKAGTPAAAGTTATETEKPKDLRSELEKAFDEMSS